MLSHFLRTTVCTTVTLPGEHSFASRVTQPLLAMLGVYHRTKISALVPTRSVQKRSTSRTAVEEPIPRFLCDNFCFVLPRLQSPRLQDLRCDQKYCLEALACTSRPWTAPQLGALRRSSMRTTCFLFLSGYLQGLSEHRRYRKQAVIVSVRTLPPCLGVSVVRAETLRTRYRLRQILKPSKTAVTFRRKQ